MTLPLTHVGIAPIVRIEEACRAEASSLGSGKDRKASIANYTLRLLRGNPLRSADSDPAGLPKPANRSVYRPNRAPLGASPVHPVPHALRFTGSPKSGTNAGLSAARCFYLDPCPFYQTYTLMRVTLKTQYLPTASISLEP